MATGHIRKRETLTGVSYQVIVETVAQESKTGKRARIYKSFEKKKEAEDYLTKTLHELKSGTYAYDDNTTVETLMENWLRSKELKLKKTTFTRYRQQVDWYINPLLGKYRVSALNVAIIQDWINTIYKHSPTVKNNGKPLAPKSVRNIFLNLQAAMNYAVVMNLIPKNPCKNVNLPPVIKNEVEAYNEDEIRQILRCAEGTDLYFPIYMLIHTGMRRGELLGLQWKNVHIDKEELHPYIEITQTRLSACDKVIIDTPKTKSSNRKVFLSELARQEFLNYRLWVKMVFFRHGRAVKQDDFVIIRSDGTLEHPNQLTKRWNIFLAENNIRPLKLHGLRHTCATMLLKNNVDIKTISDRLGHSDTNMVLNVYGHSLESMGQAAAETMDTVMDISSVG